jgi:hypothetical protein
MAEVVIHPFRSCLFDRSRQCLPRFQGDIEVTCRTRLMLQRSAVKCLVAVLAFYRVVRHDNVQELRAVQGTRSRRRSAGSVFARVSRLRGMRRAALEEPSSQQVSKCQPSRVVNLGLTFAWASASCLSLQMRHLWPSPWVVVVARRQFSTAVPQTRLASVLTAVHPRTSVSASRPHEGRIILSSVAEWHPCRSRASLSVIVC